MQNQVEVRDLEAHPGSVESPRRDQDEGDAEDARPYDSRWAAPHCVFQWSRIEAKVR